MPQSTQARSAKNIFQNGVPTGSTPYGPSVDGVPLEQAMQQPPAAPTPPPPLSTTDALRLRQIMESKGREGLGEDKYSQAASRLRGYYQKYPEELKRHAQEVQQTREKQARDAWMEENLDTTPEASSRLQKGIRKAAQSSFLGIKKLPKSLEDLPAVAPDSRDGIIQRKEQEGMDTTSGLGNFGDVAKASLKLRNSQSQLLTLLATAQDKLDEAGVVLPKGVQAFDVDEELGQYFYYRPTEDGKVKKTLVDSETLRVSDLGEIADVRELLAGVGAAVALASGPKHPIIAELVGDVVGRTLGTTLQVLLDSGNLSEEEISQAYSPLGIGFEAGANTFLSRMTTRVGSHIKNRGRAGVAGSDTPASVNANIQEAADTMEGIHALTGNKNFTVERGSLSAREAQIQSSKEKRLSSKHRDNIEMERLARIESLAEANKAVAAKGGVGTDSPAYASTGTDDLVDAATGTVNAQRAATNAKIKEYGEIVTADVKRDEGITTRRYSFAGETNKPAPKGTVVGDNGVHVEISHETQEVVFKEMSTGKDFEGATTLLLQKAMDDVPAGYRIVTSNHVSPDTQRTVAVMRRAGYTIQQNPTYPKTEKGFLAGVDGQPVYEVIARPGQIVAPQEVLAAKINTDVITSQLDKVAELVPVTKQLAEESNSFLKGVIGWSEQRQISKYRVANGGRSGISTTVRRIQNRAEQALTGADASEANRLLASALRSEADEEGGQILAGLASDSLDVGNLLKARSTLNSILDRTNDPDVGELIKGVDNLLKNSKITGPNGKPISAAVRSNMNEAIQRSRTATATYDEAVAMTNANAMLKQSPDGEFLNVSVKGLENMLGNYSRFLTHMAPLIKSSPGLRESSIDALRAIYKKNVLDAGSGWTKSRHQSFLNRFGDTAKKIMTPDEFEVLNSIKPPPGGTGRLDTIMSMARGTHSRTVNRYVKANPEKGLVGSVNANDIVSSFTSMGPSKARRFMEDLRQSNPDMAEEIASRARRQVRDNLHNKFFDANNPTARGSGSQLTAWVNENEGVLGALAGDRAAGAQYVADLKLVARGLNLDQMRKKVKGHAMETQGNILRLFRANIGPMDKNQRRITATSFVNQRRLARQALNMLNDPAKLREVVAAKHIQPRTQEGIAFLTRIGYWEAIGIAPEGESFQEEVLQYFDWLDRAGARALEDKAGNE